MKILNILFLFSISITLSLSQPTKEKLSLNHYADYEWAGNPQLSPDGEQILYSRTWIDLVNDKRSTDLWIMEKDGSKNRYFINGSNGKWSPDGTRIAFTRKGDPSGTQIFIKYVGASGPATQITRLEKSPSNITWSPDSKFLAFNMHVPEKTELKADIPSPPKGAKWTKAPTVIDKPIYRRDRVGYFEPGFTHVFIVSSEGGKPRQVTNGDWHHRGRLAWTPDSKKLIVSSLRIPEADYARRESEFVYN